MGDFSSFTFFWTNPRMELATMRLSVLAAVWESGSKQFSCCRSWVLALEDVQGLAGWSHVFVLFVVFIAVLFVQGFPRRSRLRGGRGIHQTQPREFGRGIVQDHVRVAYVQTL